MNLIMNRFLVIFTFCIVAMSSFAMTDAERRVYYLDVTGSMRNNKINGESCWDVVTGNLKNAINRIDNPETEIIVIPFTDSGHGLNNVIRGRATSADKKRINAEIDKLDTEDKCYTNLNVPMIDFLKNHIASDRPTYMFLMTDGVSNEDRKGFLNSINRWGDRAGRDVYGFYVKLHGSAIDADVSKSIGKQNGNRLWEVGDASVNINMMRALRSPVFNPRNEKYVDIPFSGDIKNASIRCTLKDNEYYALTGTEIVGNSIRCRLKPLKSLSVIPQDYVVDLNFSQSRKGEFDCLLTGSLPVKCINKKERTLKVKIK